ncbi:hypothetical protein DS745_03770 [Anaerobacillus alkaliphilus]|uniref:Uncharacterized protein n=1 Tax=Anaerobacillus alkaliphilus TaxID=1548597 RepID=A0A4Q0W1Q3_9BACI|nr:hypothetical protein DS745_03770 [Anaerobacillus alkaliphilus]
MNVGGGASGLGFRNTYDNILFNYDQHVCFIPIILDDNLKEINMGEWEGETFSILVSWKR